jgi:hypothetical protein
LKGYVRKLYKLHPTTSSNKLHFWVELRMQKMRADRKKIKKKKKSAILLTFGQGESK